MKSIGLSLLALLAFPAQAPGPAALAVDASCVSYAKTHTLVRNDVLAKLDAADQNLPKAEAALKQAEIDLKALKAAADALKEHETILQEHITLLENALKMQREAYVACASNTDPAKSIAGAVSNTISSLAGDAWETVDAPLAFAAGAGMCVGIAWGLNQVQK